MRVRIMSEGGGGGCTLPKYQSFTCSDILPLAKLTQRLGPETAKGQLPKCYYNCFITQHSL
jgi:hypothetical protein